VRGGLPVGTLVPAGAAEPGHQLLRPPHDQHADRPGAEHLGGPFGRTGGLARPRLVPGGAVNSHDLTVLGYLAVLLARIALQPRAPGTGAPLPPRGGVCAWARTPRPRRVGLLVAWAWVGLHFFARLSRGGEPGPRHSAVITAGHQRMFSLVARVLINFP